MINIELTTEQVKLLYGVLSSFEEVSSEVEVIKDILHTSLRIYSEDMNPIGYFRLRMNGLSKEMIQEEFLINDVDIEILEITYEKYKEYNSNGTLKEAIIRWNDINLKKADIKIG